MNKKSHFPLIIDQEWFKNETSIPWLDEFYTKLLSIWQLTKTNNTNYCLSFAYVCIFKMGFITIFHNGLVLSEI